MHVQSLMVISIRQRERVASVMARHSVSPVGERVILAEEG